MQKQKDYLCLPANQTHITVGFSSEHTAIDFGWLVASNSKNQDLVAVSDCEVIQTTYYNDGGYTSVIAWEDADNTWFAEYMHNLKDSAVKVGTILKQGQKVAKMGNTGTSHGEHVHFVLIKAPKSSKYSNAGMRKYRVDPAKYLYVFPNQTLKVGSLPKKPTKPYLNDINLIKENSFEFVTDRTINVRTEPSTINSKVTRVTKKGESIKYDAKVDNDGHRWVSLIENGQRVYIACREIKNGKLGEHWGEVKSVKNELKVDSKVKVKQTATSYVTGQKIPNFVKGSTYTVSEFSKGKDKILIKEIMSWVYAKDVDLL